jgi:hypothetical protein
MRILNAAVWVLIAGGLAVAVAVTFGGCGSPTIRLDNPPAVVQSGAVQAPVTVNFPDDIVGNLVRDILPAVPSMIPPIVFNVQAPVQVGQAGGTTIGDALKSLWPYLLAGSGGIGGLAYLSGHRHGTRAVSRKFSRST